MAIAMAATANGRGLATLESLKELISAVSFRPREHLPCPGLKAGLPIGSLCEVSGAGKTDFIVRFLTANPKMRVAWIEEELSVYPWAVFQKNAGLERILFMEAGADSQWAVLRALRSQLFGAVIFSSSTTTARSSETGPRPVTRSSETGQASGNWHSSERTLRSIQLTAEKSRATMIFLSDEPTNAWPISLQVQIQQQQYPNASIEAAEAGLRSAPHIEILRQRY